jgi:hypothetical protein
MDYERSIRSRAEKIWNEAKARRDLTFKSFLGGLLRTARGWKKGAYTHAPLLAIRRERAALSVTDCSRM